MAQTAAVVVIMAEPNASAFAALLSEYRKSGAHTGLREAGLTQAQLRRQTPPEEVIDSRQVRRHLRAHQPVSLTATQPVIEEN